MSSSDVIRLGALAALVGGVYFIVAAALTNFVESRVAYNAIEAPAYAVLVLGLVGVHASQVGRFGTLGKVGFYVALAGLALTAFCDLAIVLIEAVSGPDTAPGWLDDFLYIRGLLLTIFGSVLFGIAIFRANVLPRGAALLLIIGPLLDLGMIFGGVGNVWLLTVPEVLFGAAWAWLGYAILSGRSTAPHSRELG